MTETTTPSLPRRLIGIALGVLGLCLIYFMSLRTGAAFIVRGFSSADTCWLIKLGQYIATSGIPKTDPFTFTLQIYANNMHPQPYVVYQWLSELVFFQAYRVTSFDGLAALCAIITAIAFICIPMRCCIRANAPMPWSFFAVAFVSLADNVRCVIRPEIFTCLWISTTLAVLQRERHKVANGTARGVSWPVVGAIAAIFCIWANQHSGFVAGLILLGLNAMGFCAEDVAAKRPISGPSKTVLFGLGAGTAATLINPYGFGLWAYIPHLFFAPINKMIGELRPLTVEALVDAAFLPFVFVLMICYGAIILHLIHIIQKNPARLKSPLHLSSIVIILIATLAAFATRRMVSVVGLILVIETANLLGAAASSLKWSKFWNSKLSFLFIEGAVLCLVPLGAFDMRKHIPFELPSPTAEFAPPVAGVNAFLSKYDGGRIYAAPAIADMLELYLSPKNSIFIDTRFDAFPEKVLKNWLLISNSRPESRELIKAYDFRWVWAFPSQPLTMMLKMNPRWELVYEDRQVAFFKRKPDFAPPGTMQKSDTSK